ncbi:MAG: DUF4238 domain-containing protein, partial [Thermodesulfobacteriota bacterium]|nr:DUF4238 domain-containing protein [Thermodesulfobacteriota bacterium]
MGKKKIKGSRPKQYHYVPRRYLKRFVGPDGKLTVYDKGREQFRTHQDPRKVMRRKNYYRQEHAPENADKDILEKESAEFLEPKAISA